MSNIQLDGIVDVNVVLSPVTAMRADFNSALILGVTDVVKTSERVKKFYSTSEMLAAGFEVTDPEYKAAALYFAQVPRPKKVYVGIKGSGETVLVALTACRDADADWYVAIPTEDVVAGMIQNDIVELASYVQSALPSTMLALTFRASGAYATLIGALNSGNYSRTISMYDAMTDNAGKTAIAGIIGYAMGANTEGALAYTLAYKQIVGLTADDTLTEGELTALLAINGNIYINQATKYNIFRQGKMAGGTSFDEILYLDMLVEAIKINVMSALTTSLKIPQTNAGVNILLDAVADACEGFVGIGFLAEGVWNGPAVLSLKTGDALSRGYLVQFETLESQSQVDRDARIAPNCYVAVKTAGAIEHVVIAVTVNR